jgi:hypothetical protein
MLTKSPLLPLIISLLFSVAQLSAGDVLRFQPKEGDMTLEVREALESSDAKDITLVFEKGIYHFKADYAAGKYCYITNHGNGYKKIIFPFHGYDSVTIKGNGAEFIFSGQVMPFQFENCGKVTMSGVTIDWDIPFLFQGTVTAVNEAEKWWEIDPFTKGFSWSLKRGQILFPSVDEFDFASLGSTLTFDPKTKAVSHGAWDQSLRPRFVEERPDGKLRFYDDLKRFPEVNTIISSKGAKKENRYAPAIQVISSNNSVFEDVTIHHALGMGFLFERAENARLTGCGIYVREGSPRVVSIIADATHFCNVKGDVLIENCRFENMLDDGTNVHGTYVKVDEILDEHTVRVSLEHFQQTGFKFAGVGDEIWFIHQPDPSRGTTNTVKKVKTINDHYSVITFTKPITKQLKAGDVLENKTWNPTFTMRGCTIRNHRARNIVLKTPKKILIEDNDFSSMMSSVFFRGETHYWFESGNVEDVLIRNNRFNYCAYSGSEHAVLNITPRLGSSFDKRIRFDRNIRFEDNVINTFDNRIVWADRVDGLTIKGNKITKTGGQPQLYPDAPLFELTNCLNVTISNNTYEGKHKESIVADKASRENMVVRKNKGFNQRLDRKR